MADEPMQDAEEKKEPKEIDEKWEEVDDNFRFHGKCFFLTYPQSNDLDHEWIRDSLLESFPDITHLYVGKEQHKDGNDHYHVCGKFREVKDLKGARIFDIPLASHPNIQSAKQWKNVKRYVCKDRAVLTYGNDPDVDWSTSHNFQKKMADHKAWLKHLNGNCRPIFQGRFNIGPERFDLDLNIKKRHLWIYGDPDIGKTSLIDRALHKYKVFKRMEGPYPFEGFDNDDIIWYDDVEPINKSEICHMTNRYLTQTKVWGPTRYFNYWMPEYKNILLIVCVNDPPVWANCDWFKARFNVHHMYWKDGAIKIDIIL